MNDEVKNAVEGKYLTGELCYTFKKVVYEKENMTDYAMVFFKGSKAIAYIVYHLAVKECTLSVCKGCSLKLETLDWRTTNERNL